MRNCPTCETPVDGLSCAKCGWSSTGKATAAVDPNRFLCADELNGQRCAQAGVYSPSTLGSTAWFCHRHARHLGGIVGSTPRDPAAQRLFEAQRKRHRTADAIAEEIAERLALQAPDA